MSLVAISMVLASAFMHASWNLLAKRVGSGRGPVYVWLFDALATLIYAVPALILILLLKPKFGLLEVVFILGSATLHLTYFILLQQGYKKGDLSLVYPLARGTGPVLSTTCAILLFGERPGILAIIGAVLVASGVFILTGGVGKIRHSQAREAIIFGLLTGVLIAGYTLWDKQAVSTYQIQPLFLYYFSTMVRMLLLAPYALRYRPEIQQAWQEHRLEVLGVSLLSPLSYFLVLTALVFTPVSYVAPFREISILVGAILGTRLLAEKDSARRTIAAGAMVLGVVSLALG
ncbi:MAG TPA: EamA family transporter [Chloroflexia bacterium]|nr:EamA family transporter [Chloroflexia bacterium]